MHYGKLSKIAILRTYVHLDWQVTLFSLSWKVG